MWRNRYRQHKSSKLIVKNIENVRKNILKCLKTRKGKFSVLNDNYIECELGSLFKVRMLESFL